MDESAFTMFTSRTPVLYIDDPSLDDSAFLMSTARNPLVYTDGASLDVSAFPVSFLSYGTLHR